MLPNELLQFVQQKKNISMEFVKQAKVHGGGRIRLICMVLAYKSYMLFDFFKNMA